MILKRSVRARLNKMASIIREKKAVSEPEKKAEEKRRRTIATIWVKISGCKNYITLLYKI